MVVVEEGWGCPVGVMVQVGVSGCAVTPFPPVAGSQPVDADRVVPELFGQALFLNKTYHYTAQKYQATFSLLGLGPAGCNLAK